MTLLQRRACLESAQLYAILDTGYVAPAQILNIAQKLIASGVDLLQFRAKKMPLSEIVRLGQELRALIPAGGPLFILNDHPGLVEDIGADGVHVGQDDLSVETAREQAGAESLVGKSTHSLAQARAAEEEGADYIGVGPIFATPTKPDYPPVGLELIGQVRAKVRVPHFCIGGINEATLPSVVAAGARRVVIVSALLQSAHIPADCRRVCSTLESGTSSKLSQ
jgi:thiamine-phosphate pyrophosphorylase